MAEPFIGEIKCFSFGKIPSGWAPCNGQLLPINQYQALYAILGTTYGGDGITTFALPDLRGRVPVHVGNGVTLGQKAGEEAHTLTVNEMPAHTHPVTASSSAANKRTPAGNVWGSPTTNVYATQSNTVMSMQALTTAGSSNAHPNMQPYNVANYCIALIGIFPTQN
ncbi:phage tail protein [Lysinibacillus sp. BW-2-10]|uniref:phage tail protein n=1 Tax=Lysinibacillus sp. BW-2-10 TaxID=2590030 RepID=UPI00117F0F73|nr:tail fiber protein [Lysinibacillus sp. BW-2-10]TSI05171.1 phage tail protein [Lysinibacillus sp. BW-2-10]